MDSAARRKRQNRLNQRAYSESCNCLGYVSIIKIKRFLGRRKAQGQAIQSQPSNLPCTWEYQLVLLPTNQPIQSSSLSLIPTHSSLPPTRPPLIPYLTAHSHSLLPGPITFPLTPDHLITLVQFNVLRATLTNMSILSLLQNLPLECGNALAIPILPAPTTIPDSLKATPLQKSTPHELWIDTLPLGQMRDNMILMEGDYDHDDLCTDMVGGLFEGFNDREFGFQVSCSDC